MIKKFATFHNHKGFTLAETLITLVIIGIVAALTVPNMIIKHQKEETVIKLKKAYSTMSSIVNKAIFEHGPMKNWEIEQGQTKEFVDKYISPYLNVAKNCGYEYTGDCEFTIAYLNKRNNKIVCGSNMYKLLLADNTLLLFQPVNKYDYTLNDITVPLSNLAVFIDINGAKGPNVLGRDIFYFVYFIQQDLSRVGGLDNSGKFLPEGGTLATSEGLTREYFKNRSCKKNGKGQHCAGLIMADNWEIKDDYPW